MTHQGGDSRGCPRVAGRASRGRARGRATALALLAAQLLAVGLGDRAAGAPGDLDPSFGAGGTVVTDFGASELVTALVLQADGKIVVAGNTGTSTPSLALNALVARYNPDGLLDATFGTGGRVIADLSGNETLTGLALQPDGKIVVGFTGFVPGGTTTFVVARLNPDGSFDPGFGTGGKVTTPIAGSVVRASALARQPDGKIVVTGRQDADLIVVRYTASGSLDPSFGTGGMVTTDLGGSGDEGNAVAVQPDGKILVGAFGALVRYQPGGSLDPTFGSSGILLTGVNALVLQPDGKIVLCAGSADLGLVRRNPDGSPDASFGIGGRVDTDLGGLESCGGLALQPDGKIVILGGRSTGAAFVGSLVARYNPDGSLDLTFGTGGIALNGLTLDASPVLQPDGRIVALSRPFSPTTQGDVGLARFQGGSRLLAVTSLLSGGLNGEPANGPSESPALSGDGTTVAFRSLATNVAAGCTNGLAQIIVRMRASQSRVCASSDAGGIQGNGPSAAPALNGDGTVVAFESTATNLVPGCSGGLSQIVVVNLATGTRTCASAVGLVPGNGPSHAPTLDDAGTLVAFDSTARNLAAPCADGTRQVFVRPIAGGAPTCESVAGGAPANADSTAASLSGDGSRIAFQSRATNLASPCTTGVDQIFVRTRATGALVCASVSAGGAAGDAASEAPSLNGDGLVVVFASAATNLAPPAAALQAPRAGSPGPVAQTDLGSAILRSQPAQRNIDILLGGNGSSTNPQQSRDGRAIAAESTSSDATPDDRGSGRDVFATELRVPPPRSRAAIVTPANGLRLPLTTPATVTFRWTEIPGAALYGFEFTGPNLAFGNPNGPGPDPVNGFGGAGGGFPVSGTTFSAPLGPGFPPGTYQVRVIGLTAGIVPIGTFSDAVTLLLGVVSIPPDARPTLTGPADGAVLTRNAQAGFSWTVVSGVAQYLFEFTRPGAQFANPNGPGPDPANALGSVVVQGTTFAVVVPADVTPGAYQVRVISLTAAGTPVGTFSDAVTVTVP